MNQKHNIESINRKAWENVTDLFSNYRSEIKVTSLFKNFSCFLPQGSEVLDVGCGTGIPFGKYISDQNHYLTGIDFSRGMITKAKQNVPKGKFRVQSMETISEIENYDGIVASYSLQLLSPETFSNVISLCSNALKQNGFLYISLNEPVIERDDFTVFMGERMFFKDYSETELTNIFEKQGLIKKEVQRSVEDSETFGKEYMIEMIFQKYIQQ